ncbi:hypothetical protein [Phyllobacterium myrsinacearum]|uniref:Cytosine/uracil/thiamine/allantoin permease n=1 Tax=Phyllobacterium myrsinacearum TaxID=28101 RepID=A0A839EGE0_9HYPH|nr:hypothetical protein [Phyllobacterium myrsinacearum]MBA8879031.1 cytosine/uracil/thiamine/allantoin permease [Phyllobacterium myrsinacearum]
MRNSTIPHTKTFRDGAFIALIIWLLVLPLTLMTQVFAPSVFTLLEGIGNFQYKPWIILAPTVCTLIVALGIIPGYQNLKVIAGAAACSVGVIIAASIAFLLVIVAIPRLHS